MPVVKLGRILFADDNLPCLLALLLLRAQAEISY
jgi:hypothetical protein